MVLDAIRSFFQDRLSHAEDEHQPDRVAIAACALLLEIAHADGLGPAEHASILKAVREDLCVADDDVQELLRLAEDARRDSVDLYQFTRLVSENFSFAQRVRLVEAIWRVVYSDGILSAVENQLARRIGELVGLQPPDVQAARSRILADRKPST
jgi:uncharacterized tellurite resistance protein B-like protein